MNRHLFITIVLCCISIAYASAQGAESLQFDVNGEFKIAQFTDLHWNPKDSNSDETASIIKHVLSIEKPNLAILTGDVVCYKPVLDGWKAIARIFEEAGVPWMVLLGNHDAEHDMTREEIYDFLTGNSCYINPIEPDHKYGTGNYLLHIRQSDNSRIAAAVYGFNSNDYTPNSEKYGYYDWIHFDQIAWYRSISRKIPSLAFFHIPIPEYNELIQSKGYYGEQLEDKASSPEINSGFFASAIEMSDIMGIFAGHDHDNCFIGFKNGIALGYGRVTGINAYGKLERGARMMLLRENQYAFDTWIRTKTGVLQEFNYTKPI